ncbi:MAG: FAD-dependent oxidoreductase, partial [Kiritimatiellia bacterium]|nr:FAD-dependent oxidoreductase [Kiritimatiellia bacterium]
MRRDLQRLGSSHFDLVILGGGVYGLAAAREAALRGLSVALIEKDDFGQHTSAASLKLIHGGLRYLQHLNFRRMRISIRERSLLLRLAPHLVHPVEFVIPCTGHAMKGPEVLRLALLANDLISWDRNRGLSPDHFIPAGRLLSRAECLRRLPGFRESSISGGVSFCDAQMYNSERLTLAFATSAVEQGAVLANRVEATGFEVRKGRIHAVRAVDQETRQTMDIAGDFFLNMTGPWGGLTSGLLRSAPERRVLRSKGIQLVTRSISEVGFPIESRQKDVTARIRRGGRNYFVTPWRGHSLIGTTDTLFEGDPDSFAITERDVADFLAELQSLYPSAGLRREDVRFWIGGLRPL